jgi:DNA-binding transcriptional ArsR family regulator
MTRRDESGMNRVCIALADPTRRRILERLLDEPGSTTGRVATASPALSRWAITKHLAVLRDAGLVRTLPEGRRRRHWAQPGAFAELRAWLGRIPG